jgi:hypothetical protein
LISTQLSQGLLNLADLFLKFAGYLFHRDLLHPALDYRLVARSDRIYTHGYPPGSALELSYFPRIEKSAG